MTHVQEVQKQGNDLFNYSQLHASNDCLQTLWTTRKKKTLNLIVEVLITTKGFCTSNCTSFNNLPSKKSIVFFLPKTRKINKKDGDNSY